MPGSSTYSKPEPGYAQNVCAGNQLRSCRKGLTEIVTKMSMIICVQDERQSGVDGEVKGQHGDWTQADLSEVRCQQCRIQRCNADYVASTSPNQALPEETPLDVDYCIALRAYSVCTRKTAKSCRGDLVYHSAVFRIKELFTQYNCSSDGPTSSANAPGTPDPLVSELCSYESRSGFQKKFAHCGLFGDPHLRTFKDEFQTCKVEGAWPLIDNQYLSVQVTNVPVVLGSSATATSKGIGFSWPLLLYSSPGCFTSTDPGVESSPAQLIMETQGPKHAPAWSTQEVVDLIAVWGEESTEAELRSSRRNADIYAKITQGMREKGYTRDRQQYRVKIKDLRQACQKKREANSHSGSAPQTGHFYEELYAILGNDPITTPKRPVETSWATSSNNEEDIVDEEEENITLIFKSYQGCTEQKVYQATTEDLPLAFSDGTRTGGWQEGASSLRILEKPDAGQVEIQASYIGSTVIIRQVGRYLTFAIRVPEETLNLSEESAGLQLCLHGCPKNELIQEHRLSLASSSPLWPSSRRAYTVEMATEQCRHILQVEDVYFQSCVFDLLTTGDPEFSMAAYGALEDLKALYPSRLKLHTVSKTINVATGAPGPGQPAASLVWCGLAFLKLLWCC
ncbi:Repulsive guidance molecule A [Chelonia mydas]|uniref:Repulsive guidance molecule A n=1 Tax=Chelonia mydas TaxID=8469 RepID=M7AIL9_CHEMY|nr:Repulsive guidance molecule A [Chelonia mydas]